MQERMIFELNKKSRNTGKWWMSRNQRLQERKQVQKLFNRWAMGIDEKYSYRTHSIITGGDYLENLRRHEASWG